LFASTPTQWCRLWPKVIHFILFLMPGSPWRITWAVSTELLLEYEEVLTRMSGPARWRRLARLMDLAELTSGNLLRVTPSFHFQIITSDPDDNIFTDCAVTASADYLITEDQHFAALRNAGYKPQPITPGEFISKFIIGTPPG
jgi:predicted nucleic acid-binding protein